MPIYFWFCFLTPTVSKANTAKYYDEGKSLKCADTYLFLHIYTKSTGINYSNIIGSKNNLNLYLGSNLYISGLTICFLRKILRYNFSFHLSAESVIMLDSIFFT